MGGTINNLARAYYVRVRGDHAQNIEQAISYLQQTLEVYTFQANPERWANAQYNLGDVYSERIYGEQAENHEQAIHYYQQALVVYTRQTYPRDWAQTQNNLGIAYYQHIHGERAENIEQAIYHYQQALKVYTRQAFPRDWAMTKHNLGIVYAERIEGAHAENIEQAIHYFQQALEVRTRQSLPSACRATALALGNLAFDIHHWELAKEAFAEAFATQERLIQSSFTLEGKQAVLLAIQGISHRSAYVFMQLGELERAVEALEQGRAQLLRDSLERHRKDLEQLPALGFEELYEDYIWAIEQYENLQILREGESIHPIYMLPQIENAFEKI